MVNQRIYAYNSSDSSRSVGLGVEGSGYMTLQHVELRGQRHVILLTEQDFLELGRKRPVPYAT